MNGDELPGVPLVVDDLGEQVPAGREAWVAPDVAPMVPPWRAGLWLADRHLQDPRRAGLTVEARLFEIAAHRLVARKRCGTWFLGDDELAEIAAESPWIRLVSGDAERLAGELVDAHIWVALTVDDAAAGTSDPGYNIAAATIIHEGGDGGGSF